MVRAAVFNGDAEATRALTAAIEHNCTCDRDQEGVVTGRCSSHLSMLDQRFLDGLLFARYLRDRQVARMRGET